MSSSSGYGTSGSGSGSGSADATPASLEFTSFSNTAQPSDKNDDLNDVALDSSAFVGAPGSSFGGGGEDEDDALLGGGFDEFELGNIDDMEGGNSSGNKTNPSLGNMNFFMTMI